MTEPDLYDQPHPAIARAIRYAVRAAEQVARANMSEVAVLAEVRLQHADLYRRKAVEALAEALW